MKNFKKIGIFVFILALVITVSLTSNSPADKPFGNKVDIQFAKEIWDAMEDYDEWHMKSGFYPGQSPHGKVLRLYYNIVNVDGKPYHVIVKDNYGGEQATVENVSRSPEDYLAAVTIMVQMDDGYDPENNDWFWAKYNADGNIDENARGVKLAGRVAKGMSAGCIACHVKARDGDYIFTND